ncbi:MAG: hypothetical protein FWE05_09340 [Defluviitaleaceae bacterium]|nr:hypothetical protein [Defluviitaleaceae bacterium]
MADTVLSSQAGSLGSYDGQSLSLSSSLVSVILVDGLSLTMTTDQAVWADGVLTYTVVIANVSGEYPYTAPVVTTVLDPTLVTLVDNSVIANGTPLVLDTDYTFDVLTGTLIVTLDDIAIAGETTLTFQVQKVV